LAAYDVSVVASFDGELVFGINHAFCPSTTVRIFSLSAKVGIAFK
jgi:hypothetical protein